MRKKSHASFNQRLIGLISEPDFIRYEQILNEPNIFKIVGRAHYERWHSCYWGWLLDPGGSHLLGDYVLMRFLHLLFDDNVLKPNNKHAHDFLSIFPMVEFSDVHVAPNEFLSNETSVTGIGRFDIFVSANYSHGNHSNKLNIIFELKIDGKPETEQSKKYAEWLFGAHPDSINFLIYIIPSLRATPIETVGDNRWHCMNYQLLNDKLLTPLLDHPRLNDKVKPFIIQYIKNLKIRHNGVKMAITEEEKRIAIAVYEKYSDVFDSIYDALVSSGTINYSTSDMVSRGRASGRIAVKINDKVFSDYMIKPLIERVLQYIVDSGHVERIPLPWGLTNQRYILTNEAVALHPNGKPFFYPVTYKNYTMETHYSRDRGIAVLSALCDKMELKYEKIDT